MSAAKVPLTRVAEKGESEVTEFGAGLETGKIETETEFVADFNR